MFEYTYSIQMYLVEMLDSLWVGFVGVTIGVQTQ